MQKAQWITLHFPIDNVPITIRADAIECFHAVEHGTAVFLSSGKSVVSFESTDEITKKMSK